MSVENPRILVVQRVLPSYRLAFFQSLASSSSFRFEIAYGQPSVDSALESVRNPPGIDIVRLENLYWGKNERFVYQKGLSRSLHNKKYEVVIAEFNPRIVSNLQLYFFAKKLGVKFIWWGHGFGPHSTRAIRKIRLWLTKHAEAVLFYDTTQKDAFVTLGLPEEKAFIAQNSLDLEEISHFAQIGQREERNRILYIGRLIPRKKVDLLIRGFAEAYPAMHPSNLLTIIGDGPERKKLEILAVQMGVASQVEFHGPIYEQRLLAPLFNSAWISVSPGYVGLSAIHSLAYGVPMLVARDEPHSPEVTLLEEGENTLFFTSDRIEELAQKLSALANRSHYWERMANVASSIVKKQIGIPVMVNAFEQAIRKSLLD